MGRKQGKKRRGRPWDWVVPALLGVTVALFCLWAAGSWAMPLLVGRWPRFHIALTVEDGRVAFTLQLATPERAEEE